VADDEKYLVPTDKSAGDYVYAAVKAGLASVPVAGGAASEIFVAVVTPPLEKRRTEWMHDVGEGLRRLEQERGIDLAALAENDQFIDIVMSASAAALKTSSHRKREALKNAVLNVAAGDSPEESLAQVFVALVDQFTEWHLKILKLFQNPRPYVSNTNLMSSSLNRTLLDVFPELKDQSMLYEQIWTDLSERGLVNTPGLKGMMTADGALAKRTTERGDRFLAFVEA
jgi:hypothetical protein